MNWYKRWRPSRRWLVLPPLVAGVVAIALFVRGEKELVRVDATERPLPTRVVRVARRSFAATAIGYGTAAPARRWTSVAEVSGTIKRIHDDLRSGNRVEQGELLVEIDDRDYQLRVVQREADLASARANVDELLASESADRMSLEIEQKLLVVAEDERERIQRLRQTNAASRSELDQAQAELLRQKQAVQSLRNSLSLVPSRVAAAKAAIAMAEARLEEAQRELARTKIIAPFSGRLSGVTVEPDQVVSLATRLFDLLDVDTIEIEAEFSPSQILPMLRVLAEDSAPSPDTTLAAAIRHGQFDAVAILRSGQAELRWPATPVRLAETVDPATRTLGIIVSVDNAVVDPAAGVGDVDTPASANLADRERQKTYGPSFSGANRMMRLHPGLYCEVKLTSVSLQESLLIPATAVDGDSVYVVSSGNQMQRRAVEIASIFDQTVAISAGLEAGELVVLRPPVPAIDGMLVMPVISDDALQGSAVSLTADSSP